MSQEILQSQPCEEHTVSKRQFSIWLYLLIVFALSWPFQIVAAMWGTELLPRYALHATSMTMVTVGTFICGRYIFKDGFKDAGWSWGKPRHYVAVVGLCVLLWVAPAAIDWKLGKIVLPEKLSPTQWIWIAVFLLDFIPCFGEEFGWRGYMLPRLAKRYTPRKAVLIHSIIWFIWHWPIVIGLSVWLGKAGAGEMGLGTAGAVAVMIPAILLVTAIPAILHGVVFAYFWVWSSSLAVVTVYHLAYDGIRDSIQSFIGNGPVTGTWPIVILSLAGIILLWKGNWKRLEVFQNDKEIDMATETAGQ